jgi:2,3-bisphosphoglycerate-dependent phosphoglycerate mutase
MAIALMIDNVATELGRGDFVHAFFSTISARLEPEGWGTRFPVLMTELYQGEMPKAHAAHALEELRTARKELLTFSPTEVVWDIENRSAQPPWGMNISSDITLLANYFVTSTGRDMFDTMIEDLEFLRDQGNGPATLTQI